MHPLARRRLQRELSALADGDRGAFDGVFTASWPVLRSIAIRLLGDDAEAEDAAQRALLKLFSQASRFDSKREALPWVLTFVINECRTVRNHRRRRAMEPLVGEVASGDDPEAVLLNADLVRALQDVVGTLTVDDSAALGLLPSIDCSATAVALRKRKQRALSRLRLAWRRIHGLA